MSEKKVHITSFEENVKLCSFITVEKPQSRCPVLQYLSGTGFCFSGRLGSQGRNPAILLNFEGDFFIFMCIANEKVKVLYIVAIALALTKAELQQEGIFFLIHLFA